MYINIAATALPVPRCPYGSAGSVLTTRTERGPYERAAWKGQASYGSQTALLFGFTFPILSCLHTLKYKYSGVLPTLVAL